MIERATTGTFNDHKASVTLDAIGLEPYPLTH